jgi:hypothetical protein
MKLAKKWTKNNQSFKKNTRPSLLNPFRILRTSLADQLTDLFLLKEFQYKAYFVK